jgi:quercetin dioxygenase-like cupin family protein
MEKETLGVIPSIQMDQGSLNSSLLNFDLPILIEEMKHSYSWAKGGINARILLKRPDKQIVLTAFQEGIKIKSFQSNASISFQIIEGKLKFQTRKESVILEKGQFMAFHENIKYSLTTNEKTVFLLTIAGSTIQSAVN